EEFVDWLRESAVHVAEMLRIAQVHGALEQFQRWTQLSTQGSDEPENVVTLSHSEESAPSSSQAEERGAPGETASKRHPRGRLSLALAASVVGLALLGVWI